MQENRALLTQVASWLIPQPAPPRSQSLWLPQAFVASSTFPFVTVHPWELGSLALCAARLEQSWILPGIKDLKGSAGHALMWIFAFPEQTQAPGSLSPVLGGLWQREGSGNWSRVEAGAEPCWAQFREMNGGERSVLLRAHLPWPGASREQAGANICVNCW